MASNFWQGLKDGLRGDRVAGLLFRSPLIRARVVSGLLLNGGLLLGSLLVYSLLIAPLADRLRVPGGLIEGLFSLLFSVLWLYPLQLVAMVLAIFWVQDIYDEGLVTLRRHHPAPAHLQPAPARGALKFQLRVSNEVLRGVVLLFFQLQTALLPLLLPWPLGALLRSVHLAWFYAFQTFEYRCYAEHKTVDESAAWLHAHWQYFLGFGAPLGLLLPLFPGMWSSALFLLVFPFCVLASIQARPAAPPGQTPLPVFALAFALNRQLFRSCRPLITRKKSEPLPEAAKTRDSQLLERIQKDLDLTESLHLRESSHSLHEEEAREPAEQ